MPQERRIKDGNYTCSVASCGRRATGRLYNKYARKALHNRCLCDQCYRAYKLGRANAQGKLRYILSKYGLCVDYKGRVLWYDDKRIEEDEEK